jgi:murein DD-endopeptidase MepM/ murein hydrolase activator NlpD
MSDKIHTHWRPFQSWRIYLKQPSTIITIFVVALGIIYMAVTLVRTLRDSRTQSFLLWRQGDEAARQALVTVQREACPGAPFILPADGYVGLLYGDPRGPYSRTAPHQGIDIFSDTEPGVTPVYAAYDGYVTREPT